MNAHQLAALLLAVPAVGQTLEVSQVTQPSLAVSPDGATLFFQLLGDLVAVPASGGAARVLTSGPAYDGWPAVSPDGDHLYFLSDRAGYRNGVHRLRLDDLAVERVPTFEGAPIELALAPDGSTVAALTASGFEWRRTASGAILTPLPPLRAASLLADGRIAAVDRSDGPGGKLLCGGSAGREVLYEPEPGRRLEWTSVAPDGRYAVVAESGPWDQLKPDFTDLTVVALGTGEVVYRCDTGPYTGAANLESRAAFSATTAFLPRRGEIVAVDLATGDARTVGFTAKLSREPRKRTARARPRDRRVRGIGDIAVSPDGEHVAVAMLGDLYLSDGRALARITSGPGIDSQPAFDEAGESLWFARNGRLHRVELDDGAVTALDVPVAADFLDYFAIAPDESRLVTIGSMAAPGVREYRFATKDWTQRHATRPRRGAWVTFPGYGSAGEEIVFVGHAGRGSPQVLAIESGEARPLTTLTRSPSRAFASEDGVYLAVLLDGRVHLAERGDDLLGDGDFRPLGEIGAHTARFSRDSTRLWVGAGTTIEAFECSSGERVVRRELALEVGPEPAAPPLVLEGFRLVDVESGEVASRRVVIENGRIASVGGGSRPDGARIIDGHGRFLIPGLWDMHVHTLGPARGSMLAYGVTTVRQLGSVWPRQRVELELIERGRLLGPDYLSAGEIFEGARPSWGNAFFVLDDVTEALGLLERRVADGVDTVKLYPTLPRSIGASVTSRANASGVPVTAHVATLRAVVTAIDDGVACLEHYPEHVPDVGDDLLAAMATAGVAWCPTLCQRGGGDYKLRLAAEEFDEPLFKRSIDPVRLRMWRARPKIDYSSDDNLLAMLDERCAALARAVRAGVRVVVGSDCSFGNALIGPSTHWEIEFLVRGGLTEHEALFAATRAPALFSGLSDRGLIRAGMHADLAVLRENPLEDIENTRSVDAVIKRGRWLR